MGESLKSQFIDIDDKISEMACILCETKYLLPTDQSDFLSHLFNEHKLVIGDVNKISSIKSYVRYWKTRLKGESLTTFCTTMIIDNSGLKNQSAPNNNKFYFLLSDSLAEDKILREELQEAKLNWVLSEQVRERGDQTFKRGCFFCKTEFTGSCIEFVKHLGIKHNFLLGNPDNLVFIEELLDKVEFNLNNYVCIYCEKIFKNREVLKEHMRKKLHKRVNPYKKEYDKYYIQNYTVNFKSQSTQNKDDLESVEEKDENDWSDWANELINIKCIFCDYKNSLFEEILNHMDIHHEFDFKYITRHFSFYQKVKIVNFLRDKINKNECFKCNKEFNINADLILHLLDERPFILPSKHLWDHQRFYSPVMENDAFLYNLDTNSDDESD